MSEQETVRSDPGIIVAVLRNGQTDLLTFVVVCSGVEHIPYSLVLNHGRGLGATHFPRILRLHKRAVRSKEGPFVGTVVAAVRSLGHTHYLVGGGCVPGGEQEDQLVLHLVHFRIDGTLYGPIGFGDDYRPVAGVCEGYSILAGRVPDIADSVSPLPGHLVEDMDLSVEFPDARRYGSVYLFALSITQVQVADPRPVDQVRTSCNAGMPVVEFRRGAVLLRVRVERHHGIIHKIFVPVPDHGRILGDRVLL